MTAQNKPTWMARHIDWEQAIRIPAQFRAHDLNDRAIDTSNARYAKAQRLRRRLLADGERTYTAYSAHELLEIDSQADRARPGHPLG
jgi:hypothetical protein